MDIIAIIQARVGSTRLPNKVLLPLGGKTVLEQVASRVGRSKLINKVMVATTTNSDDDAIVEILEKAGIESFRGSENDLLDRYYQAAKLHKPKHIVRITADCPLIDSDVIDAVISLHLKDKNDYTASAFVETFPDGLDVDVMTFKALEESWKNATIPYQREHVTQFIAKNPHRFKIGNHYHTENLSDKRWCMDEPNDYAFVEAVYSALGAERDYFGMEDVLRFLSANPDVEKINQNIIRNAGILKSTGAEADLLLERKTMRTGQNLYKRAKGIIPAGTQILSKRPELHLPGGWPSYYKKAKGCEIWDMDGKKYVDMSYMGIGACAIGYADPDIDKAVKKTIDNGIAATFNSPKELELADMLLELHPWADMVRYACGGGEIMAIAIRIARAKSGKDKVLFCGYHGWHDWYLSSNLADDKALDGHLLPGLKPLGVPRALKGTAMPFMYNDTEAFLKLAKKHKGEIGAVVIEGMRSYEPVKGFLETIRKVTKEEKIPFIIDEVSSGFRLTTGGAHIKLGIKPDMAAFAKALGNGYPIAAVIGKKEVMDVVEDCFISSTNWSNNVGFAAAIASLKKMKEKHVVDHLIKMGKKVQDGWAKMAKKNGVNIHLSGFYAIGHFDFEYENPLVLKTLFTQEMLKRGFLATNAYYASYAHKTKHIKAYLEKCDEVFAIVAEAIKSGKPESYLEGNICHAGFRRLT